MRYYIEEAIQLIKKLQERPYQRYVSFIGNGIYRNETGRVWAKKYSLGYRFMPLYLKMEDLSFRDFVRLLSEHGFSGYEIKSR